MQGGLCQPHKSSMGEFVWKVLITTCKLCAPCSLRHPLGSCHHYVAINPTWGKPPGLILTSWSPRVSKQEFNQGRREQQSGQGRGGNGAKQPKFFLHTGRKDISFQSLVLQTHGTNPYVQGILRGDWLQHFELLRKANVRTEFWPVHLEILLFLGCPVKGWTYVTLSRGSASRR